MWPPIPHDLDKRKKKEKPIPGRIRNKTKSQWENYLPVFEQWEKKKKKISQQLWPPIPRDPDKRKIKKHTHTHGRIGNKIKTNEEKKKDK